MVGIDLGTSSSVVCVLEDGRPTVVTSAEGTWSIPSVVAFAKDRGALVGEPAKRQAVTNAGRTVRAVKRHLGTGWTAQIDGEPFTAERISAFILQKLKRDAETYLGEEVTDAVITVPVCFSEAERRATKRAGAIAGLNVLRLVKEPSSVALAYGHGRAAGDELVLVIQFGAGSFEVSLLAIGKGVVEVKAAAGDGRLGGDDWDQAVVDYLVARFKKTHGVDLSKDDTAMQRLRDAGEKAKIELSVCSETTVELPYITALAGEQVHLREQLTRARFQRLTADLLDRCRAPFHDVIKDAGVAVREIDSVVLAGGSTRMPGLADLVRELTGGKEPYPGVNSGEAAAVGAALQAGILRGEIRNALLIDVTPLSLGIQTEGGVFTKLLERNTTIPARHSEIFTTGTDLAVPQGPGGHRGESTDAGRRPIARPGGHARETSVTVRVYEGERKIAADNRLLGLFQLTGLRPASPRQARIEVALDIDADGVVIASAKDLDTGTERSITVTGTLAPLDDEPGWSADEVELCPVPDQHGAQTAGPSSAGSPSQRIRAAAADGLGEHRATFPHKLYEAKAATLTLIAIWVVIAAGVVGLAGKLASPQVPSVALLVPALAFLGAIGWLIQTLRRLIASPRHFMASFHYLRGRSVGLGFKGAHLSLYEHGLVVQSGAHASVFRWDTVLVLQDIVRVTSSYAPGQVVTRRYHLTDPSGTMYRLTGGFLSPQQWGPAIQNAVTEAQLPGAWAAIKAGRTLTFGPIALSGANVTARGESVPWAQIQAIKVDRGFVSLKVAGRWRSLTTTPVNGIPNFFVFHELAELLRCAAAETASPG